MRFNLWIMQQSGTWIEICRHRICPLSATWRMRICLISPFRKHLKCYRARKAKSVFKIDLSTIINRGLIHQLNLESCMKKRRKFLNSVKRQSLATSLNKTKIFLRSKKKISKKINSREKTFSNQARLILKLFSVFSLSNP